MNIIYATAQKADQNAFTTIDGRPDCTFKVFFNEVDFISAQDSTWTKSNKRFNLIKQDSQLVKKYISNDFVVDMYGNAESTSQHLDARLFDFSAIDPVFRVKDGVKVEWTSDEITKAKSEVLWYGR